MVGTWLVQRAMKRFLPRDLSLYLAGAIFARLADEGARIALVLLAVERGSGAGEGGLLVAAFLVPHVIAAPLLGNLVDRSKVPLRVVALGIVCTAAALLAAGLLAGHTHPLIVALLLFAGGCGGPAVTGGLSSQLTHLVRPEQSARAFGFDSLTYNVAGIAGPALTAAIAASASAQSAVFLLAALAVAGGVLVAFIRVTADRDTVRQPVSWSSGMQAMAASPMLAATTVAAAVAQIGLGALPVILVALLASIAEPGRAGWLLSAMAAGAVVGSILWTVRPAPRRQALPVIAAAFVLTGLCMASIVAIGLTGWWSVAVFALSGAASAFAFGATLLVRDLSAPPHLRAQVFSLAAGSKVTAGAIGAALGGSVLALPLPMLWIGLAPLVAGLALVPLIVRSNSDRPG